MTDWFDLARLGRARDASGSVTSIQYKVADRVVCLDTWAAMRGVPPATAQTIDRKLRFGDDVWNTRGRRQEAAAARAELADLSRMAMAWWHIRLGWYERIVAKGVIQHPRGICFSDVYESEFVTEMRILGCHWKLPSKIAKAKTAQPKGSNSDSEADADDTDDPGKGSRATWYKGRNMALAELGAMYNDDKKPFRLVSRKNHSAYKECADCQRLRLAIEEALKLKRSHSVVTERKALLTEHLAIVYKDRATLDRIILSSQSEGYVMENADKCGDQCLYLPSSQRISADNVSRYQYRVALQANVYASKLYHLSLLLPNLTTGANFGLTTELCGLVRMIQLGEVTAATRKFMRGIDGGSENVNHASLGMNNYLCGPKTRRFDEVLQNRLQPGHSHHYLTDGLFSVIEGWCTGPGFAGCTTLVALMELLTKKLAEAAAYHDKVVEISILAVNFAFTKWFSGHLHMDKVSKIGDPLVWRHTWVESEQRVRTQYKYLISDVGSFDKDEWGPWVERCVPVNDPESGAIVMKTVLRSDPEGVQLIASWPEIGDFPGVEEWKPEEEWKCWKVFDGLSKWKFANPNEARTAHQFWDGMKQWHAGHPDAASFSIGTPLRVTPDILLPATPTLSWREMWNVVVLAPHSSRASDGASGSTDTSTTSTAGGGFLDPRSHAAEQVAERQRAQPRNTPWLHKA